MPHDFRRALSIRYGELLSVNDTKSKGDTKSESDTKTINTKAGETSWFTDWARKVNMPGNKTRYGRSPIQVNSPESVRRLPLRTGRPRVPADR
jgi:hypothetical protein